MKSAEVGQMAIENSVNVVEQLVIRTSPVYRIKCCTPSVRLSVRPSVRQSSASLWFSRKRKAMQTDNLVET